MLVAVGRVPNSENVGFEEVGTELVGGYVRTDQRLRTSVEGVFAVGDLVPGIQLAHRGFEHGIFVAEEIAGLRPRPVDDSGIPRITYSRPEVASVGLTAEAARHLHGSDVLVSQYDMGGNGKSQIHRESGHVIMVARADGPLLGVHLVGERVSELMGEAQQLVRLGISPSEAACQVHAHPTLSEAVGEALLMLAGEPLHVHA